MHPSTEEHVSKTTRRDRVWVSSGNGIGGKSMNYNLEYVVSYGSDKLGMFWHCSHTAQTLTGVPFVFA